MLGERPRRRLDDLVERTPRQRDLLEAEADVHVVAGVDGVVLAARLDVRDPLQHEELVAVQGGRRAGDPEDAPLHHVVEPVGQAGGAVLRDAGSLLLLPLHRHQQPGGGAVAGGTLQVEHRGDARGELLSRDAGGPGQPPAAVVGPRNHAVRRHPAIVLRPQRAEEAANGHGPVPDRAGRVLTARPAGARRTAPPTGAPPRRRRPVRRAPTSRRTPGRTGTARRAVRSRRPWPHPAESGSGSST